MATPGLFRGPEPRGYRTPLATGLVPSQHPGDRGAQSPRPNGGPAVSRTPARHRKPPRSSSARPGVHARRHKRSPITSALVSKPTLIAAVAGSTLVVSTPLAPAPAHWTPSAPRPPPPAQASGAPRGLPPPAASRAAAP